MLKVAPQSLMPLPPVRNAWLWIDRSAVLQRHVPDTVAVDVVAELRVVDAPAEDGLVRVERAGRLGHRGRRQRHQRGPAGIALVAEPAPRPSPLRARLPRNCDPEIVTCAVRSEKAATFTSPPPPMAKGPLAVLLVIALFVIVAGESNSPARLIMPPAPGSPAVLWSTVEFVSVSPTGGRTTTWFGPRLPPRDLPAGQVRPQPVVRPRPSSPAPHEPAQRPVLPQRSHRRSRRYRLPSAEAASLTTLDPVNEMLAPSPRDPAAFSEKLRGRADRIAGHRRAA